MERILASSIYADTRKTQTAYGLVEKPFFIVGSERSGTTLLRMMLDGHPEISCCAEFNYAVDLLSNQGRLPKLSDYYQYLESNRDFLMDGYKVDRQLDYAELVNSFLKQNSKEANKAFYGATVHRHFDRILHIWPNAMFIHLVRDGRDVSQSCIDMGWAGNLWYASDRWIEAEQLWETVSQKLPENRKIEVKFEQLVEDSERTLSSICQLMGTQYHADMLEVYVEQSDYDKPNSKLAYKWRKRFSNRDIRLVESRIAPLLEARGYVLSGLPAMRISPLKRVYLYLHNKTGKFSRRTNEYGLGLVLADMLSRRIRLASLQQAVQKRMQIISVRGMKKGW